VGLREQVETTPSGKAEMKCPRCGSDNREGAKFCLHCGERLEQSCPQCGRTLLLTAKFCDECGYDLTKPRQIPHVDYSHPQSYTPKFLANKILTARNSIEGERKLVTALFADVVNYTSISEKLDPEEIHQIMDGCFKLMMDEVHRYEGTVTQFTGDGIMGLFGAPLAHEDHAQRTCYAALSIQKAMEKYGEKIQREYGVEFKIRIGINSGLVSVGSIGDDLRMDYTALGDTINLASRLQKMGTPGSVLVSRDTHKMAKDFFKFKSLGKITVKGKEEPLEAYEVIEAGEVETRLGAAAVRGLTKFVGRERELGIFKRAFEKVQSGLGQVIGLVGEAGVGKSRLILEFKGMLRHTAYTYLEGECLHFGSSMAYLPILDIVRSYFNIKEGLQEHIVKRRMDERIDSLDQKLRYILPPLHELLSLCVKDELFMKLEPKLKRERTFEAIRDLLVRESQQNPLVLVVEDLQWIDKTSEEFLNYLIGWLANTPILLILLFRPEYTYSWGNKSYYSRIGLDQLPIMERRKLVESVLQGTEVSTELHDLITSKAGGNPLFMEELTYALLESGYIEKSKHGYRLSRKVWEIQVPDTIQGIIASRMDRLHENLKRTMQVASVIGRDFAFSILETITRMKEELKSYLLELQGLELVYEQSLFPELEYTFKHALVQEVAYNSLLLRRRREIHEKVANAIETLYADRVEEFYEKLAYHFSKSENTEKAYKYLKLSGIKATQNSSLWEAFCFYKEAINVLKKEPQTDENKKEQIELRLLVASPMISLGFPEDSLQILQDGEKFSREIGAIKSLTTFCSIMGLYYSVKGDPLAGVKYSEECFEIAEKAKEIELMAPIAFDLCSNYAARGEFLKVVEVAPKILSLLEEGKREFESFERGYNIYSALMAFYGFSTGSLGNFEKGKMLCQKALEVALKIGNLYSLGLVEVLYGYVCAYKGDGKEALEHFQNSIQYLEKGQIFVLLGMAWSGLGLAHYFMGEPEAAHTYIEKGLKLHSNAGITYDLSVHYYFLALVHSDLSDLQKAQEYAEEALRLAQKNEEIYYVGLANIVLGRILAKAGGSQTAKAEDYILQGIKISETLKVKPYIAIGHLCLAELYTYTGRIEKAMKSLKTAEGMFREAGMDYWMARIQTALKRM
jgi:class 3 adenylate cyclase/tetratricopeptide (TPR) repeat protein